MSNGNILKSWYTPQGVMQPRVIDSNNLVDQKMKEHEVYRQHTQDVKVRAHQAYGDDLFHDGQEDSDGFVEGLFAERIDTYTDEEGNLVYGEVDPSEALTRELLAEKGLDENENKKDSIQGTGFYGNENLSEREKLEYEKREFAEQQNAYQEALEELEARYQAILRLETETRIKTDEMIRTARDEAEKLKQEAVEQGKLLGIEQGKEEGLSLAATEVEQKEADLEQERETLEAHFEKTMAELEPKFVCVMNGIYRHIFDVDFGNHKEVIHYLISKTLRRTDCGKNYIVHVSKDEYPYVSQQKKQLQGSILSDANIDIVEDLTLHSNECLIETEGGIFDCGVGTALTELEKELTLLSYQPPRVR